MGRVDQQPALAFNHESREDGVSDRLSGDIQAQR